MSKLRLSHRIALSFFGIALLILLIMFFITNAPIPQTKTDTVGEAMVRFTTPDSQILSTESCYNVAWEVSNIEAVYLNDSGQIGTGEEQLCYDEYAEPELLVEFEDGTSQTYTLDIIVLERHPSFWFVIGLIVLLLFFSLYFTVVPLLGVTLRTNRKARRILIEAISFTIVTLIVSGGILEFGFRFYFTNYGRESERIRYIYDSIELQEKTSRMLGVPFITYVNNPTYTGHNDLGYRGEEFTIDKPEGVYRIVTIGSSTTYGFGVNANQAYPVVLENELQEDFGYDYVEVINAGVIGYSSFEILTNFQFRVLELDPDLVIYYGGKSDSDTRLEDPGCFNGNSPLYGLTTKHGLWRTEYKDLPNSTVLRYLMINTGMLSPPNSLDFALADIPIETNCASETNYTEAERLSLNDNRFIERNFRNLLALAQFHDIDVIVSEFIHPGTLEQVEGDELLLLSDEQQQAIAEINQSYRDIAEEMGVYYYALGEDFVIEPGDFWTVVHMKAQGAEKQGKLYAKFIADNNIIPPLSELDGD